MDNYRNKNRNNNGNSLGHVGIFYYQKCGDSMGISCEYTLWLINIPMEATAHI